MPNRFQHALARRGGILAGRRWSLQHARGRRLPVEVRPCEGGVAFTKNDILSSRAQRAFVVLESAGAWRRLAAAYRASGDPERANACKRAAYAHLFSAVRARLDAESTPASILAAPHLEAAE
jgi:hypothetical protein